MIVLLNPPAYDGATYIRDAYCAGLAKGRYSWPPLDLVMVSGTLAAGSGVRVVDATAEGLDAAKAARRVASLRPTAIVSMTSSASAEKDFEFFALLKQAMPDVALVILGDLAAVRARETLADAPVLDGAICNFMDPAIADGFTKDGLVPARNLVCRMGGEIAGEGRVTVAAPRIPTPRHDLFPLHRYRTPWARRRWITTTATSDGCPFSCAYCTIGLLKYAARPVQDVLAELRAIRAAGAREVYFQDPLFTADRERARALCGEMERAAADLSWCCLVRVGTFDAATLEAMARAGCHTVQLGLESASDRVLGRMGKGITVADTRRDVTACRRAELRVDAIFMLGYPGETESEMLETVELARTLDLHFATFVIVTPSPGVRMVRELAADGVRVDPRRSYDDAENILPLTSVSAERLRALRRLAERRFYLRAVQIARMLLGLRTWTEVRWTAAAGLSFLSGRFRRARRDAGPRAS